MFTTHLYTFTHGQPPQLYGALPSTCQHFPSPHPPQYTPTPPHISHLPPYHTTDTHPPPPSRYDTFAPGHARAGVPLPTIPLQLHVGRAYSSVLHVLLLQLFTNTQLCYVHTYLRLDLPDFAFGWFTHFTVITFTHLLLLHTRCYTFSSVVAYPFAPTLHTPLPQLIHTAVRAFFVDFLVHVFVLPIPYLQF